MKKILCAVAVAAVAMLALAASASANVPRFEAMTVSVEVEYGGIIYWHHYDVILNGVSRIQTQLFPLASSRIGTMRRRLFPTLRYQ